MQMSNTIAEARNIQKSGWGEEDEEWQKDRVLLG